MTSSTKLLKVAVYPLFALGAFYVVVLGLFTLPALQTEALYVHRLQYPLFVVYDNPERYGLAPYKTRNMYLNTSDGETIGAWHVLPRSVYLNSGVVPPAALPTSVFEDALSERPTIIYFHGNAGMRATTHRIRGYSAFSNTLDVNVLVIDYRGFGDSTGTPSEAGLLLDARAAWDYVASHASSTGGKDASKEIILVGQSLGTGVVSALAGSLALENIFPRALVLIAPFSSLHELLLDYTLFWVIPLLKPLKAFPALQRRLLGTLEAKFDSATSLLQARSPTLILCAKDDSIIPHFHSETLFNHLVRDAKRNPVGGAGVTEQNYPGWGRISRLSRAVKNGGDVVWWEGLAGGHNNLGWAEGTVDLIQVIAAL